MSPVPVVMVLVSALVGPGQDERYERALALADARRPAEAAVEFEALAASGDASSHFEAGQMRFAAGHMAHAYPAPAPGPRHRPRRSRADPLR